MADHRMLSKRILGSTKFLKMPVDTRDLYFYLNMYADDDGIVEAYQVMKMLGSSEDNIRILAAKEYIKILNDDLVTYILDWREHNSLRADRKINSFYKDLLIQIIPDVKLLEPKQRADRKKEDGTSIGQPEDSQCPEEVKLGKVNSSKVKKSKVNLDEGEIIYECEFFKVYDKRNNNYKEFHPTLNLITEYKKARQWLIDNNKTMSKWTFITNWLNKAEEYKKNDNIKKNSWDDPKYD